jgi:hypothetical protein
MLTVYFEDHGQDFLEWDIEDGKVVGCRPFQGWLWEGRRVYNTSIQPGDFLNISCKDGRRLTINYAVEKVIELVAK